LENGIFLHTRSDGNLFPFSDIRMKTKEDMPSNILSLCSQTHAKSFVSASRKPTYWPIPSITIGGHTVHTLWVVDSSLSLAPQSPTTFLKALNSTGVKGPKRTKACRKKN
jgi:hypothetical protein